MTNENYPNRLLRRKDAAAYIQENFGQHCTGAYLAKLAVTGSGPVFRKAGKFPLYAPIDLDDWAQKRLTRAVRSTSELPRPAAPVPAPERQPR